MTYGCRHLCNTIHFHQHFVSSCCTNVDGLILGYGKDNITSDIIKSKYSDFIEQLKTGEAPEICRNCYALEKDFDLSQIKEIKLKTFYISNWLHCNANCIYCVHKHLKDENNPITDEIKISDTYSVLPTLESLKKDGLIAQNPVVFITGGEPALLKELPEVIEFFKDMQAGFFQIYSSAVMFSDAIDNLLKSDITTELIVSPDCADRELYKQIKRIDKFDDVINNLKKYNSGITKTQNRVISKYICIKDVNDNEENLKAWIDLMHAIGIKNIRIDVDYDYPDKANSVIPSLFKTAKRYTTFLNMNLELTEMTLNNLKS